MGVDHLNRSPAIFLDRDGVINRNVLNPATDEWESPLTPEQVVLTPGVLPALRRLREAKFFLFVVSNQPNYAKGKTSLETLNAIHERLAGILKEAGIEIDAWYYCFHHPEGIVAGYAGACTCRKPSPFFLLQARDEFSIDMENSWMVGDRPGDVACGRAAGVRTIRVHHAEEGQAGRELDSAPDYVAEGLAEAVEIILREA